MSRYFAKCLGYENVEFNMPKRATKNAAGYDFFAVEEITYTLSPAKQPSQ